MLILKIRMFNEHTWVQISSHPKNIINFYMKKFTYEFFYKINIINIIFIFLFLYLYFTELSLLFFFDNLYIDINFFFKINNFETQLIEFQNSSIIDINSDLQNELNDYLIIKNNYIFFIILTIYYVFFIIYPLFLYEFYLFINTSIYIYEKQIFITIILIYCFQYSIFFLLTKEISIFNQFNYNHESFFIEYINENINLVNIIIFKIIINFIFFNIYIFFLLFKYNYKFFIFINIVYIFFFNYEFIIILFMQIFLLLFIHIININIFYYKKYLLKIKLINYQIS